MSQANCVKVRIDKDPTEEGRLTFVFAVLCLVVAIIAISINRSYAAICSFCVFLTFALLGFVVLAIVHFMVNRTFDKIDECGIRRVDRGEELFFIPWDDITSVTFMWKFIYLPLKAYWLSVDCKKEIVIKKSKKDKGSISTTISINVPRVLRTKINSLIPESIPRF